MRKTHTECVQKYSSMFPLLLGENVLWKLMDGCEGKIYHDIYFASFKMFANLFNLLSNRWVFNQQMKRDLNFGHFCFYFIIFVISTRVQIICNAKHLFYIKEWNETGRELELAAASCPPLSAKLRLKLALRHLGCPPFSCHCTRQPWECGTAPIHNSEPSWMNFKIQLRLELLIAALLCETTIGGRAHNKHSVAVELHGDCVD